MGFIEKIIKIFMRSTKNEIKRPEILSFMSIDDYKYAYSLFEMKKNSKYGRITQEYLDKEYPYSKFNWLTCVEIIRIWEMHKTYSKLEDFKRNNITKVKLVCYEDCACCQNYKDIPISINEVRELPMKDCDIKSSLCKGASYMAVLNYDD